jgi:hypothetical protein
LSFVVYSTQRQRAVALYDTESAAKARVTRNNKQQFWRALTRHTDSAEEWAYCSWAEFEAIALKSRRRGYQNYHEF